MRPLLLSRGKRYSLYISILLIVFGLIMLVYLVAKPVKQWPIPAQELSVSQDMRMVRGAYLVEQIAHCAHCHSPTDASKFGFPIIEATKYGGAYLMGHKQDVPAELYAANISPYGLSKYSDDELYRALTQGVAKDGHVMFPIMPYRAYGKMDPDDIWAMIGYLRTLPSIKQTVPASEIDFPASLIIKLNQPTPAPVKFASLSQPAELGAYYANIAGCITCHSPENSQYEADLSRAGAGGRAFKLPNGGTVYTPNLTPHVTGLSRWTEERFINQLKQYADSSYQPATIKPGQMNSNMAWHSFAGIHTADLKSIFSYLKTLTPQDNKVKAFVPITSN